MNPTPPSIAPGERPSTKLTPAALLHHATEPSPVPTVLTTGAQHVVEHGNPAFLQLVGASPDHVEGRPLVAFFADAGALAELLDRVHASSVSDVAIDLAYTRADARTAYCTALVQPRLDEQARCKGLLVCLLDTTEQVRARHRAAQAAAEAQQANEALLLAGLREQELAERALQQAAEMNALLDNMTEGVVIAGGSGKIVLMNPVGREMLGFPEMPTLEEYHRLDLRRRDGTTPVPVEERGLSRAIRGEQFSDDEMTLIRPDGSQRHLLCSGSALRDPSGAVVLAINVFRDITRLRELEATREEFVALVSHDLRGPLSSARIAAEILHRHPEMLAERPDIAAKILTNLDRTDRMVRNLLDAHRIRAGQRLPLDLERCDLAAIARDVAEELTAIHGDRFQLRLENEVMGFFSPGELRRALWNLASNAVKYGARETPIVIAVERMPEGARVLVRNQGPPIPPEQQPLLFRPFSQARAEGNATARGWGLGLTLVLGCAQAHGGRVTVESTAESGTTFALELPLDARPYQTSSHTET